MCSYSSDLLFDMACDIAVHITYLISHNSSLSSHSVIKEYFWVGCIINTKLPSCVDNPPYIHSVFQAGALKAFTLQTRASRATAVKTS